MKVGDITLNPNTTLLEVAIKGGFTFEELTTVLDSTMRELKCNSTRNLDGQNDEKLYQRINWILEELNCTVFYEYKSYSILLEAIVISYKAISDMLYSLTGQTYPVQKKNFSITELKPSFYFKVTRALAEKFQKTESEIARDLLNDCRFVWTKNSDYVQIKYFHRCHSQDPPWRPNIKSGYIPVNPPSYPKPCELIGRIVDRLLIETPDSIPFEIVLEDTTNN